MKVVIERGNHPYDDWKQWERLLIDGKLMYDIGDGEPEDNSLARNFSFDVAQIIKLAHKAGMNKESLEIEYLNGQEDEEIDQEDE